MCDENETWKLWKVFRVSILLFFFSSFFQLILQCQTLTTNSAVVCQVTEKTAFSAAVCHQLGNDNHHYSSVTSHPKIPSCLSPHTKTPTCLSPQTKTLNCLLPNTKTPSRLSPHTNTLSCLSLNTKSINCLSPCTKTTSWYSPHTKTNSCLSPHHLTQQRCIETLTNNGNNVNTFMLLIIVLVWFLLFITSSIYGRSIVLHRLFSMKIIDTTIFGGYHFVLYAQFYVFFKWFFFDFIIYLYEFCFYKW